MNLVVKELGPEFLQQGVWLKCQTLMGIYRNVIWRN